MIVLVIWIINTRVLRIRVDLVLDSIWSILVFCCKFSTLEFFFTMHVFEKKIIQEWINQTYNSNENSSFRNGLNHSFSSTGFYFKSEIIEGNHEVKNNMFFNFRAFFSKCTFLRLSSCLSNQQDFSREVLIYKIHIFDETFSLLTIRMSLVNKLVTVVTYREELPSINLINLHELYDMTNKIHISTCRRPMSTKLGKILICILRAIWSFDHVSNITLSQDL